MFFGFGQISGSLTSKRLSGCSPMSGCRPRFDQPGGEVGTDSPLTPPDEAGVADRDLPVDQADTDGVISLAIVRFEDPQAREGASEHRWESVCV